MKSCDWKDIELFLVDELKKTKHIMTFGTIGSLNVEHDIDVIVTKKPGSSTSSFFQELHEVFFSLDEHLKSKYNINAVRFSATEEEYFLRGILTGKNVYFHTHAYMSYPQLERDWNWALSDDESVSKIIDNDHKCLIGSSNDLYSRDFVKKNYYDSVFVFLYRYDKINSHYPKNVLISAMNHYFDYFYRKKFSWKTPRVKNLKEIRVAFYKFCDELDKLARKR